MESVAIIGTGIAGMSCAHRLHGRVDLTLFEAEIEPGGHTHTVDIHKPRRSIPVDTGFMVYNETTYPLLTQLFKELKVDTFETEMSFGVQYKPRGIEFCGSTINQVFAQRRNTFSPRFLNMIREIMRFNKLATVQLESSEILDMTLEDFVRTHRFGQTFLDCYLVPMTSAIWSTPPDEMLRFPAHTLIRFMFNHGLLGVNTHHQWRTVKGGSRQYRDKLIAPFKEKIRCGNPVRHIQRTEDGVRLCDASGDWHGFDKVVVATHADTALQMLTDPTVKEADLLGAFPYAANKITLHRDESVMPASRRAWASWNYSVDRLADGTTQASTHYWMNTLQNIQSDENYFVSVNEPGQIDPETIYQEFPFDHPMFSRKAAEAQFELPLLNENRKLYYCGSYFRYGFHEDGILSGYSAAERLLAHSATHAKLAI